MNSLGGMQKVRAYHPSGNFNINALIDEITNLECLGYEVGAIIVTSDQWAELVRSQKGTMSMSPVKPGEVRLFGCDVEISELPIWVVIIEAEF